MGKGGTRDKRSGRKDGGAEGQRAPGRAATGGHGPDGGGQGVDGEADKDGHKDRGSRRPLDEAVRPAVVTSLPTPDPLPAGPPKPKKDKGGRPTKASIAENEREELAAATRQREAESKELAPLLSEILTCPFDVVAARRGDHWKLTSKERDQFSLATSRLCVKYLPGFFLRFKEEAMFLLLGVAIIMPRIREDRELARERDGMPRGDRNPGERQDNAGQVSPRAAGVG